MSKKKEDIKRLIKRNEFEKALDLMIQISNDHDIIIDAENLKSEFYDLERDNRRNKLSRKEYKDEKGQLRIKVIELSRLIFRELGNRPIKSEFEANVETFMEQSLSNDNLIIDNQKYMIQLQLTEFNKIKGRFDKLHDDIDNHVNLLSVELNKIIIPNISIFSNRIDLWLPNSDKLASNGKQYLISAEYLYDYITTLGENEYSPFVHQYCRTIENELKDLFKLYNQDIRSRKSQDDIDALAIAETASGVPRNQRHGEFASKVKSNKISNFKNMIDILRKVNVATTLLFADFKIYIQNRYDLSIILDNTLLDEIDFIRDEYRNQAAHPFDETILLNNVKADECKAKVKVVLNKWISGKK